MCHFHSSSGFWTANGSLHSAVTAAPLALVCIWHRRPACTCGWKHTLFNLSLEKCTLMATDKMYKTSVAVSTVASTHEPRAKKSCCPKQSEINMSPFFRGSSDKRLFCLLSQGGFSTLKWPSQVVPAHYLPLFCFPPYWKNTLIPRLPTAWRQIYQAEFKC